MKSISFKLLLILLTFIAFAPIVNAQRVPKDDVPFRVGEILNYEAKYAKILDFSIAELSFSVAEDSSGRNLRIGTEANSKGTLLKLAKYSFLQQYESTIDFDFFRVLKTTKHDVQKDRVRDSEAVFDYRENRVTFVESDPKNPNRPPRKIASKLEGPTNDIVSGIYFLRTQPLTVGKNFEVTISDSGLVYTIQIRVTARESQKSIFGKTMCYRVEPLIFGRGRFIEQKGSMVIWITDDARRVPVRALIDSEVGKFDIRLKSATGTKEAFEK